jgi:hypothetical protein
MDETDLDEDDGSAWLDSLPPEQLAALRELLAISAKQLDDGKFGDTDMEKLLAEGRARRAGAIAAE